MSNATIDTSELEYLKSCRDKLRDIGEILGKNEGDNEEKLKRLKGLLGRTFLSLPRWQEIKGLSL